MQAEFPNIGEKWSNPFYSITIKDILSTTSIATGLTSHLVVGVDANILCYFELNHFTKLFKLTQEADNLFKDFELDQNKMQLERLYNN